METFGEKLRQAVESRGLPIEEVAAATGLGIEHIQALERNDFGALPDDDIVREGLRSFARLVDVNADEVIQDYLRERQGWPTVLVEDEPSESGEWLVVEPSRPRLGHAGRIAILTSAILALAAIAFLLWPRTSTAPEPRQRAVAQDAQAPRESPGASDAPSRSLTSTKQIPAVERPTGASRLSIPEHGVGRGVVHHELVGKAERFTEGERVWFWTQVQGGAAGESIDHVWLHEDEEVSRVSLRLGGARWRTKSDKDLNPGSRGRWAVEARDEAGRVLARQEFHCSARP